MIDAINEFFSVTVFASPLLSSITIVVSYLIAQRIIRMLFRIILFKIVKKTKTTLDDRLMKIFEPAVFWTVFLIGIYIAMFPFDMSMQQMMIIRRILLSFGALVLGYCIAGFIQVFIVAIKHRMDTHAKAMWSDFFPFIDSLVKFFVIGLAIFYILDLWEINIAPIIASAGVLGVALAFAAKDTVANLFGGVSVFFDRPYKTGDYVIINDKYRGEVVEIGLRSTKIKTRDNILLTVPNSVMVTNAVVNETGFDPRLRVRIPMNVEYGSDLNKTEKLLIKTVKAHALIEKSYAPRVRFRSFGENGLELEVLGMITKPAERGKIIHELIKAIDVALKKEKISLPCPKRDVYIHSDRASKN